MAWSQTTNIKGPPGIIGPPGPGIVFKGTVPTVADLPTDAIPGDAYTVEADGHFYSWDGTAWIDGGYMRGEKGDKGDEGDPGPPGTTTWAGITDKPATFPPTLPIPSSGVTSLDASQAAQDAAIALRAPLASPALTGNPTAPTPVPGDNDTSLATTAFVAAALSTTGASVGTSAPASPALGKMWWHTTQKTLRIWDGTAWQDVFATWAV